MFFRTVLRPTSTGFRENARYLFLCRNFVGYAKLFQSKLLVNNYVGLPNFSGKAAVSFYSTGAEGTVYTKIKHIFGLGKLPKSIARAIGYKLYASIDGQVDHSKFFQGLQLPDTFHSWFVVRSLHVWMLMVRLMQEGEEGRYIRNALVEAMWEDVDYKSKQLGELASSVRKKQIQELVNEFQASLFSYDEGLLTSDIVLAGAIWRHVFGQGDFDPKHLSLIVEYVRQNISKLDSISYEYLRDKRDVSWVQLNL